MSEYVATVEWNRNEAIFIDSRYSRAHVWRFDGGLEVEGSASPHNVPLPFSSETAVDPEEAFVASLSSCHMLQFLYLAAKAGYCVDRYLDHAVGILAKNSDNKLAMTEVTLRPEVSYSGHQLPSLEDEARLHHQAHEDCFIANSVKTTVYCRPVLSAPP
jgi:organic hydroperoxide reductase OsmC/OhrA